MADILEMVDILETPVTPMPVPEPVKAPIVPPVSYSDRIKAGERLFTVHFHGARIQHNSTQFFFDGQLIGATQKARHWCQKKGFRFIRCSNAITDLDYTLQNEETNAD